MTTTLLLADDSVTIQRVIELTFANEDIRVVSTGDGDAAMRQIAIERPDIVLADVGMPKLDGYQVAATIKGTPELKDIPVLLLTGAFEPIDEARAHASGCDGILVKPFEPQQLVGRVKELLAGTRASALRAGHLAAAEAAPVAPAPLASPNASLAQPAVQSGPVAPPPLAPAPPVAALEAETADLMHTFQGEFDPLDAAIADLHHLDSALTLNEAEADPAVGLDASVEPARQFGDWDLPKPPPQADPVPTSESPESSAWDLGASELLSVDVEKPSLDAPVPVAPALDVPPPPALEMTTSAATGASVPALSEPPAAAPKASIASAFSALLAAEQAQPRASARGAAPSPVLSDAAVEDAVRRVLGRMTHDTVHRIVLETAERLIKEELDKIRANPT